MDKSKAALGASAAVEVCAAIDPISLSERDRILLLEEQMKHMQRILMRLKKSTAGSVPPLPASGDLNKDGIPIGTVCMGATEKSHFLFYLTVEAEGYALGSHLFASLSAAAEAASQVRRSGWTFWKLLDGTTLKEAYRS